MKTEKFTDWLVCNGTLRKDLLKKVTHQTEFRENGKVVFGGMKIIGHIAPLRYRLGEIGSENRDHYSIVAASIFKSPMVTECVVVVLVGKYIFGYRGLNDWWQKKYDMKRLPEIYNGDDSDTDIIVTTLNKPNDAKSSIICNVEEDRNPLPREIKSLYLDQCIMGIANLEEATLERYIYAGQCRPAFSVRVAMFSYDHHPFGLLEIYQQDDMGRRLSLTTGVSRLRSLKKKA